MSSSRSPVTTRLSHSGALSSRNLKDPPSGGVTRRLGKDGQSNRFKHNFVETLVLCARRTIQQSGSAMPAAASDRVPALELSTAQLFASISGYASCSGTNEMSYLLPSASRPWLGMSSYGKLVHGLFSKDSFVGNRERMPGNKKVLSTSPSFGGLS